MPKLLNTFQAAQYIGLARATLAKLRVTGGGPSYVKLGSKVLYPEDSLDSWLESQPTRTSTAGLANVEAGLRS